MRRPLWLGAGVAIGVGGTLWAERRVRKALDRLAPQSVAVEAGRSVRRLGDRVQSAVEAGRVERDRREEELWADLGGRPPGQGAPEGRVRPPDSRRRGGAARGVRGGAGARR